MQNRRAAKILDSAPSFRFVREQIPGLDGAKGGTALVVRHAGTAIVVCRYQADLILVQQYRPILEVTTLEFPGGAIKSGESPEEAVRREFWEEVGAELYKPHLLGAFYLSVGTSDEQVFIFSGECNTALSLSTIVKPTAPCEELSPLRAALVPPRKLMQMLLLGTLQDAKTSLAFLLSTNERK